MTRLPLYQADNGRRVGTTSAAPSPTGAAKAGGGFFARARAPRRRGGLVLVLLAAGAGLAIGLVMGLLAGRAPGPRALEGHLLQAMARGPGHVRQAARLGLEQVALAHKALEEDLPPGAGDALLAAAVALQQQQPKQRHAQPYDPAARAFPLLAWQRGAVAAVAAGHAGPATHLVMVPCLGIWLGSPDVLDSAAAAREALLQPGLWDLGSLPGHIQPAAYVAAIVGHIGRALDQAAADPEAVVIFSGSATRPAGGPGGAAIRSEGASYWLAASTLLRFGLAGTEAPAKQAGTGGAAGVRLPVLRRLTTEEFARDSLENLLFSVARFRAFTMQYPARVTVVGLQLKRRRFVGQHRRAMRWPRAGFHYIGLDAVATGPGQDDRFEEHFARAPFARDPYGCGADTLHAARRLAEGRSAGPPGLVPVAIDHMAARSSTAAAVAAAAGPADLAATTDGPASAGALPCEETGLPPLAPGSLLRKRLQRDPHRRAVAGIGGYMAAAPEMADLLAHCDTGLFTGVLPWARRARPVP
ncbi:hypothetical protein H696_00010 [Fonticula alba]|uniref:Uncharacterized protein n=1 Tax=Fonticula alba TaxID=691883 RepID=A0A058ZDD7_FONAL|nr:hypothetical protein H696_00010 [Fonticula alba]KCV72425.1 hypothetical protein H696_00010 [Fonticula alba]|eukprot:XP_009492126.1 hypothetical protein H696_00010 [Fonticula alba]